MLFQKSMNTLKDAYNIFDTFICNHISQVGNNKKISEHIYIYNVNADR